MIIPLCPLVFALYNEIKSFHEFCSKYRLRWSFPEEYPGRAEGRRCRTIWKQD